MTAYYSQSGDKDTLHLVIKHHQTRRKRLSYYVFIDIDYYPNGKTEKPILMIIMRNQGAKHTKPIYSVNVIGTESPLIGTAQAGFTPHIRLW